VKNILVTNDDGIHAPGLRVAERIAAELGANVWVVAPEEDCSGRSQAITMHQPLRLRECGERRFALSGTPADCVLFASAHFFANKTPDLVISGVNSGANTGDAAMYSATVGAALAAAHIGWPAVALSQAFIGDRNLIDWNVSEELSAGYIRECLKENSGISWNINFPVGPIETVRGHQFCTQGRHSIESVKGILSKDGRGIPSYWLGFEKGTAPTVEEGTDIAAVASGYVAITPLLAHRADVALVEELSNKKSFKDIVNNG